MSFKVLSFVFIVVCLILQINGLMNFPYNERLCLQELNKVLTNVNGSLASGEGFMNDCRYSHVFPGVRNGIVLSAQCPDENGDFQTSTQYFQIPPGPCKYNQN